MNKRTLNRLLLACLACLAAGWAPMAWSALPGPPAFDLRVDRIDSATDGKVYRIAASAIVAAAPAAVWRVLTDYDHLADFVPGLQSARVRSRDGDKIVVEQLGTARFLFFSHAIHLVTLVHERSPERIDVSLVEGDMRIYRCSWQLRPDAAGTKVTYSATIAPSFYVPGMIGERLVGDDIGRMLTAVLARAAREDQAGTP